METVRKKNVRSFTGKVVSAKMDKTITVLVTRAKTDPKYRKQYVASRKYKAHDENREARTGDIVLIQECRPLSKEKRWQLARIVERAPEVTKVADVEIAVGEEFPTEVKE